jgi:energy-coupling factor transporter ATP-binding protein EcfA2
VWRRGQGYDEPFGWWGPVWSQPEPRTIVDLIRDGVLSAEVAALLCELVAQRASIVVAAGPSGAGKTTLLTALLDALPAGTRRVYVRGCYEPFDFFAETDPGATALLVNEISAHLPIYLWGPGVRRVLTAAQNGYQLAATAHATSIEEFIYSLAGYPLRITADELKAIDLLVLLDAWREPDGIRRSVRQVVTLSASSGVRQIEPRIIADGRAVDLSAASDLATALDPRHSASFVEAVARRAATIERELRPHSP